MSKYRNPALKKFSDQQIKFANRDVKLTQISRAEDFIYEIQPEKTYRFSVIFERVTSRATELYPHLSITGADVIHDLRCLIEDLTDSIDLKADQIKEEVLTVNELSEKLHVSPKTVDRWREKGLVSRRLIMGNRKRIGFLRSSVDRFLADHADEIEAGARFSQLSDIEHESVIDRAKELAHEGYSATEVCHMIAREFKRAAETIRSTIQDFDRDYPEQAIFPENDAPLSDETCREIFYRFKRRVPASQLAKEYGRTASSIYRIVQEVRAARILETNLEYMHHESFDDPANEAEILGPAPKINKDKEPVAKIPPGLPPYLVGLYEVPLLTREEEGYHFRKMNYLKFKADSLRKKLNLTRPSLKLMDEIEQLIEQSIEVKNFLIRSNLRLVVSIAKKHMKPHLNFFEMVSDGNMSLIKAIEKFDYSKGNKFSTYATWAIMKNYARSIPHENKIQDRYRTGSDEVLMLSRDGREDQFAEERKHEQQKAAITEILSQLEPRDKDIIIRRFGLEKDTEPLTLEQVGEHLGVTKERIRQLESRALKKLKAILNKEKMDIPGLEL